MLHFTKEQFAELATTYHRWQRTDFTFAAWAEAFAEADRTMDTDTAVRHANDACKRAEAGWKETHG